MAKGGRKTRIQGKASSHSITFKVTKEERAALKGLAQGSGMTLSDLIRSRVFGYRVKQQPTVPRVNLDAYRELARSAANVNQLTRHLNEGRITGLGRTIHVDTLRDALKRLYRHIQELRQQLIEGDDVRQDH